MKMRKYIIAIIFALVLGEMSFFNNSQANSDTVTSSESQIAIPRAFESISINDGVDKIIYPDEKVKITIQTAPDIEDKIKNFDVELYRISCSALYLGKGENNFLGKHGGCTFNVTDPVKAYEQTFYGAGKYIILVSEELIFTDKEGARHEYFGNTGYLEVVVQDKTVGTAQPTPATDTQKEPVLLPVKVECLKLKAEPGSKKITGKLSDKVEKVMIKAGNKKYKKAKLKDTSFTLKTTKLKKGTKIHIRVYRKVDGRSLVESVKVMKVR